MISEEMLQAAAAGSCEHYTTELTKGFDPSFQHTFSSAFTKKIKKLKRRADHPVFYLSVRRIAMVILCLLIAGGAWLMISPDARADFFGWTSKLIDTYFTYHTDSRPRSDVSAVPVAAYYPEWLPEGYTETEATHSHQMTTILFKNEKDEVIRFSYMQDSGEADLYIDVSQTTEKRVEFHGLPATLFLTESENEASTVLWTGSDNTLFLISGFLNENELLKAAESISKK